MSRRAQENIVALVILGVFAGVIVLALGYGPRARMVPLPLAVFGIIAMALQIVWQNVARGDELAVDWLEVITGQGVRPQATLSAASSPELKDNSPGKREARAYGIVLVLLVLMLLCGPFPAIFAFTGGYFLLSRHYSWSKGVIYTVLFTAVLYLLFVVALDLQLYHGLLQPIVDRYR
ncbi:MAG TPA: tripartite tricarboxylate transporter TctB family protein [Burkholderiales bacterium]|nr:tripartite tricarboxylate transporter TctB family protein [Burkholderiales bacterium]